MLSTFYRVMTSQSCILELTLNFVRVMTSQTYWTSYFCESWLLNHVNLHILTGHDFSNNWSWYYRAHVELQISSAQIMNKMAGRPTLAGKSSKFFSGVLKKESILCISTIFPNWLFYKHPPSPWMNLWQHDCTGYVHTCTVMHLLEIVSGLFFVGYNFSISHNFNFSTCWTSDLCACES